MLYVDMLYRGVRKISYIAYVDGKSVVKGTFMDRSSPEEAVSVEQGIDDTGLLLKQTIPDLPVHSEGGLSR